MSGFDLERSLRNRVEDVVRVERAVVAAHARVVASDEQVRAAVVLPEEGVEQRLARSGVAHVERIARLHDGAFARSNCRRARAIALVRTSAGMSPGFSAPSSE